MNHKYTETFSGTLSWELCPTQGRQPKVLGHSTAVVGDTLYIFGGIHHGIASDALYILNTGNNINNNNNNNSLYFHTR